MPDLLRAGVGIGVLLVGAGVFYNFFVLVPQERREAAAQAQKAEEKLEFERRERTEARQKAQLDFDSCVLDAEETYNTNWDKACASQAQNNAGLLKHCIAQNLGTDWCRSTYSTKEKDCTLPKNMAEGIERYRATQKQDCLNKRKLATE